MMIGDMLKNQIWQIVDSRAYGGIESHIFYLACALKKRKRDVCVVFINDFGTHPLESKLKEQNINYLKCAGIVSFIKLVQIFKPRLIHSHGYKANLMSRLAGKLYNVPTVASYHAGDCETLRLKLYTWCDRKTAFMGQSIAVNSAIAAGVSGQAMVVDNFVPLPHQKKTLKHIENIGFVGRLSHEKAPDRFLELARRFPAMKFHIFGDGPMKKDLKDRAPKNVIFHGHVSSIDAAWHAIDVLCMPSRKEGLPLAALEAMAAGIPVLACDVGALSKVIENKVNGWIIDANQNDQAIITELESKLRDITISDAKICADNAARTIKESYSQNALAPRFTALYDALDAKAQINRESFVYAAI